MFLPAKPQGAAKMPRFHHEWTVLPHGPVHALAENLRVVTGSLPKGSLPRTCTLVRLPDAGLLIHSAIALEQAEWSRILEWGLPRILVVPIAWHRLDAPAFKKRYPDILVACPRKARRAVEKALPVDRSLEELDGDPVLGGMVSFQVPPGTRGGECLMRVRSGDGTTLVFTDLIFNLPRLEGPEGRVMTWLGSTGGPKVTPIGRLFGVSSRRNLASWLHDEAGDPQLQRLVFAHGQWITDGAADVLRQVADRLIPPKAGAG